MLDNKQLGEQHDRFMLQSFYPLQEKVIALGKLVEEERQNKSQRLMKLESARQVQIGLNTGLRDDINEVIVDLHGTGKHDAGVKQVKKVQKVSWWNIFKHD